MYENHVIQLETAKERENQYKKMSTSQAKNVTNIHKIDKVVVND